MQQCNMWNRGSRIRYLLLSDKLEQFSLFTARLHCVLYMASCNEPIYSTVGGGEGGRQCQSANIYNSELRFIYGTAFCIVFLFIILSVF
jgi:hypothetical protein